MVEKLIQHLQKKSEEHVHLKLLQSQWSFDEELIPKALQNIAAIFPHYSRHDVSHSRQILINIERLLGDTLPFLTGTDTWLLLEAAYWHDIGMIVADDDIAKDMQTFEFKQYVKDIASQSGHELQEFAKKFSSLDPKNCFSAAETPQQAVECYLQLLAGWYRVHHPKRAADIVDAPWEKAGIASPRNELVPRRLFRILGQICLLHGCNFDSILESLPHCETGMATEDCHPRFVACLLRLGDLFDLDDNRFCPVMLRVAGEIPPSSQTHIDKHAAIRHFRLDPERVEIAAECPNCESYEVTDKWFRWIEDEFRCQMTHWKDIVPNRLFESLPMLGKLEVNLTPPNEIIDTGQRPRFGIDLQQVFELLQGAGLYRDRWQSLRELLQNAVDACLMRIWLTHAENPDSEDRKIDWQNPLSPEVKKIFACYPIEVSLLKTGGTEPDRVQWRLDIRDRGIGISKQDLAFIKSVGASSKNTERKAIIARMPNWMRPSGAFGIGLQSGFMISQKISFESKSLLTGDMLKITMMSSISQQRGLIYIERCKQFPGRDCGTLLSMTIITDAIPKRVSSDRKHSVTRSVLANFDPIRMADVPYDAAKIVDEIISFSELSPIPIKLAFDGQPTTTTTNGSNILTHSPLPYFDPKTGVMLINFQFIKKTHYLPSVAFRGQQIEKYFPELPFVSFRADILAELAPDTLTINRNDVKDTARERVYKLLVDTIIDYLCSSNCHSLSDKEVPFASAFLFLRQKEDLLPDLKNKWKNIILPKNRISINEFCEKNENEIRVSWSQLNINDKSPAENPLVIEHSDATSFTSPIFDLLLKHWAEQKGFIKEDCVKDWDGKVLRFSKEFLNPFGNDRLKDVLIKRNQSYFVGGRSSMPVWDGFEKLSADVSQLIWCDSFSYFHRHQKNHFVLPFFFSTNPEKITTEGLDELCAWTEKHTLHSGTTKVEIHALYKKFIEWVDYELMAGENKWKILRGID